MVPQWWSTVDNSTRGSSLSRVQVIESLEQTTKNKGNTLLLYSEHYKENHIKFKKCQAKMEQFFQIINQNIK